MKCITPMFRKYEIGNYKNGKIVPRSEVMNGVMNYDENYIDFCLNKMNTVRSKYRYEKVPCKNCWACQLNYSAEWATRIMLEAKESENNWFITFTYDDEHLPIAEELLYNDITFCNDGTWTGTLEPEHLKTFINSLRKSYERKGFKGIKYFYCGEYGETTKRPHYHMILLNCPLDITQFYDTHVDKSFKAHWKSRELEKYWDKGMIDIAEVEWSSAAYVARYCTKKLFNEMDKTAYYEIGKIPEYIRMSKGIGYKYYQDHKDEIYQNDEMIMRTVKGNMGNMKPPKAFDRLFKEERPGEFELIQKSRKYAQKRAEKLINDISTYTDKQKLIMDAEKLKIKMSMLPREGEFDEN